MDFWPRDRRANAKCAHATTEWANALNGDVHFKLNNCGGAFIRPCGHF
jgi:hypothetical protein